MGEGTGRIIYPDRDDPAEVDPAYTTDVEQTRAEMSETIDAIQERLAPERLSEEAKEVATEVSEEARIVVNEAVETIREAFPELTGQAEQAVRDVINHALEEAKGTLPVLSEQAQETVDHIVDHAIEEAKAALRELGTQARASVRDATIGKVERMADTTNQTTRSFSSSVISTVKQNPGPAALTALGIGWLVVNGSGKGAQGTAAPSTGSGGTGSSVTGTMQGKAAGLQDSASDLAGEAQNAVTNTTDEVLHAASDAADKAQEAAGAAADQAQGAVSAATGQAEEAAVHVLDAAGNVVSGAQSTVATTADGVKGLSDRIKQVINTNPVPAGLVAVALGGAAALTLPETQREQELLGGTRDKLFDQAQTKAVDVVEKVKTVAEEAGEAVEKEAKYQGLTSDDGK
jgi:phage-related protein